MGFLIAPPFLVAHLNVNITLCIVRDRSLEWTASTLPREDSAQPIRRRKALRVGERRGKDRDSKRVSRGETAGRSGGGWFGEGGGDESLDDEEEQRGVVEKLCWRTEMAFWWMG